MIKNYYYLTLGILAILFSITHALNGLNNVLPSLNTEAITVATKTTFTYVWQIITAENLLFGITFLLMSICKDQSKVRFTAWLIAALMIFRWIVIVGETLLLNASGLKDTLIDSIGFLVFIALILLGIRAQEKSTRR